MSAPAVLTEWKVVGPDGSDLYYLRDIEVARELYRLAPAGSHLILAPEATTTPEQLQSGGEK